VNKMFAASVLALAVSPASAQSFIQNCANNPSSICGYVSEVVADGPSNPTCEQFRINGDQSTTYAFSVNSPGYASDLYAVTHSRDSNGLQNIFFDLKPTPQTAQECSSGVTPIGRIGY